MALQAAGDASPPSKSMLVSAFASAFGTHASPAAHGNMFGAEISLVGRSIHAVQCHTGRRPGGRGEGGQVCDMRKRAPGKHAVDLPPPVSVKTTGESLLTAGNVLSYTRLLATPRNRPKAIMLPRSERAVSHFVPSRILRSD